MSFNIATSLNNSFNPVPKSGQVKKQKSEQKKEKDFCIMPKNKSYSTERMQGLARHEVYFGTANRKLSIEDGLVVFLTPAMHNASKEGVHFNKKFDTKLKKIAQKAWMEYYKKTKEEFIQRYGKSN